LRKKTLDECRQMTVADILDDAERNKWGDLREWRSSWQQFRECWNAISLKTRRNAGDEEATDAIHHECKTLVIPELSDDDSAVSMIYSLPRDVGDGILILEMIQNLQNVQNDFLHSFASDATRRGHGADGLDFDLFAVQHRQTLFDLRADHCVSIDEAGLLDIIRKHSIPVISYGATLPITFDLEAIENEVVETYIVGRFPMEIDIRCFEFMGGQNTNSLIQLIAQSIAQETLSFDVWQQFDVQFETSFQRRKCLETFEECIAFLSKMKSSEISNAQTTLYQFMARTLQMADAECAVFRVQAVTADDKQLQLKHIKSLWTYLTQRLARDDATRSKAPQHTLHKYRVAMASPLQQQLAEFVKAVPLGLLGKVVLKWKNQLESYGDVEYNTVTATVNQFLFLDDDLDIPKKAKFPTLSLQHFATGFEFVASRFYALSK